MSRLGAFIVTYRRPQELERSIRALLGQTRVPDHILVVDNAACTATRELVASFQDPRLEYHAASGNLGSAGGTALGTAMLAARDFDYIYSGDDDDPPKTEDSVARILSLLESSGPEIGGAGAVGTRWCWNRGEVIRLPDEALEGPIEVDFIGGNHKLTLRREVVRELGTPNPELFFGYPDLEHCLRLRRGGCRLLVDGGLMLEYRRLSSRTGLRQKRSLLPRRSYRDLWRYYYTTRNYTFMMRRTFGRPDLALRRQVKMLPLMVSAWAKGPRYGARYGALQARGVLDAYRGRLGQTVLPRAKVPLSD